MGCFQRAELQQFLAGELNPARAAVLTAHVEECAECERALAELTVDESLPLNPEPAGDADAANEEPTGEFLNRLHGRLPPTSGLPPGTLSTAWHSQDTVAAKGASGALPEGVPGYEILGELSRGGMGVVYKARQVALNRVVALKMILTEAYGSPARRARFRSEAEAVARLQHPNIVQIYDIGEHAGCPYFTMELISGPTLTEACMGRPQSPSSAAALTEILARAVHCAHLQGIIHRDLKRDNVLLASGLSGGWSPNPSAGHAPFTPKIIDFGLAKRQGDLKLTQYGQVLGTPSYMAPEQVTGKGAEVGPATDVYALGAMLYELLTGRPPFLADSVESTLALAIREEPIPLRRLQPKLSRDLETICLKCLEKSPARRYAQAIQLADDLRRFQAHEPIAARPPSSWDRATKFVRRHKGLVAGVAATLAAMLVGTIVSLLFAVGESRQRRLADDNAQHMAEARRQAECEAYEARLGAAQARLEGHSVREATEQLDNAAEYLRGWEWFHLQSRLDESIAVVGAPGSNPGLMPATGHVVLTSQDDRVSLWDADNHKLRELAVGRMLGVASSRIGSLVFVERRADSALLAFDDAGRPAASLDVHGPISSFAAALSADGKQLALGWTTDTMQTVALFDPATGTLLSLLPPAQNGGAILGLAFSPDGRHLVAAIWGANLEVWDVPQRRHLVAWHATNWDLAKR